MCFRCLGMPLCVPMCVCVCCRFLLLCKRLAQFSPSCRIARCMWLAAGVFFAQLEVQNKDWDRLKKGDLTLQASQIAMTAPEGDLVSVDVVRMHGSVIRMGMAGWLTAGVLMCAALSRVGCVARRGCSCGPGAHGRVGRGRDDGMRAWDVFLTEGVHAALVHMAGWAGVGMMACTALSHVGCAARAARRLAFVRPLCVVV